MSPNLNITINNKKNQHNQLILNQIWLHNNILDQNIDAATQVWGVQAALNDRYETNSSGYVEMCIKCLSDLIKWNRLAGRISYALQTYESFTAFLLSLCFCGKRIGTLETAYIGCSTKQSSLDTQCWDKYCAQSI